MDFIDKAGTQARQQSEEVSAALSIGTCPWKDCRLPENTSTGEKEN